MGHSSSCGEEKYKLYRAELCPFLRGNGRAVRKSPTGPSARQSKTHLGVVSELSFPRRNFLARPMAKFQKRKTTLHRAWFRLVQVRAKLNAP